MTNNIMFELFNTHSSTGRCTCISLQILESSTVSMSVNIATE